MHIYNDEQTFTKHKAAYLAYRADHMTSETPHKDCHDTLLPTSCLRLSTARTSKTTTSVAVGTARQSAKYCVKKQVQDTTRWTTVVAIMKKEHPSAIIQLRHIRKLTLSRIRYPTSKHAYFVYAIKCYHCCYYSSHLTQHNYV